MSNLSTPNDVHIGGTGSYVYVASTANDLVIKYDGTGNWQSDIGSSGSGDGELNAPYGVFVYEEELYVTDQTNNRCEVFNLAGVYQRQWAVTTPYGLSVYEGKVYIASGHTILVYNLTGTLQITIGESGSGNGQFSTPKGVSVYNDSVYVADSGNSRVQRFTTAGVYELQWGSSGTGNGQFTNLRGIWADANGVYTTDDHRIQNFSYNGTYLNRFGSVGTGNLNFDTPSGLCIFTDSNPTTYVYIADSANDRVVYYSLSAILNDLQTSFKATDTVGNIYYYGATNSGYMHRLEHGTHMDGSEIAYSLWTGDIAPDKNNAQMITNLRKFKYVGVSKTTTPNNVTVNHYADTSTSATNTFTLDPERSGKRITSAKKDMDTDGIYHSFKLSLSTDDETFGFEPLYLAGFFKRKSPDERS